MCARTSTWAGTPEALDSWVRHVTEKVAPMVAVFQTAAAPTSFVDQDQGRALTLTLWTSEGAALRRETADKSRDSTIAATGVELLKSMALLIGPPVLGSISASGKPPLGQVDRI
jgi:hypothetical protein